MTAGPRHEAAAAAPPWITANQVTTARLVPMPLVAWLVYRGEPGWWIAIVLALVIGSTDYLDGYLARKHGPTMLGALLNPLADKVFLALLYVPLADLGFLPVWAVALMFTREFLVTALRSAYAQRRIQFETSYLAKVKTWVQMQGVITMMACALLPPTGAVIGLGGFLAISLALLIGGKLARGRWSRSFGVAVVFAVWPLALYLVADQLGRPRLFTVGATSILTAMTWFSALDYLVGGLGRLRAAGGLGRADWVRLIAAVATPAIALAVLLRTGAAPWAVLAVLALELALGGLDNLLSTAGRAVPATRWGLRALGVVALLAAALVVPGAADELAVVAVVLSAIGAVIEFWRARDLLLASA